MCKRAVALLGRGGEGSGRVGEWWLGLEGEGLAIMGFRVVAEVDLRGRFEGGDLESWVVAGGSFWAVLRFLSVVLEVFDGVYGLCLDRVFNWSLVVGQLVGLL